MPAGAMNAWRRQEAAWWAPAWIVLAGLQALTFDAAATNWGQLWAHSLGYLFIPFWLGWWLPSGLRREVHPAWRVLLAAVACFLWNLM